MPKTHKVCQEELVPGLGLSFVFLNPNAQIQPSLAKSKLSLMFHDTLSSPFYEKMFSNSRDKFEDLIVCEFQRSRSCKRKRSIDSSAQSRKIPRTSANLEIFGVLISDLFPHMVEKQYLTPSPMKIMPNTFSHNYDPDNTCDFHMGAPEHAIKKCRPLMEEIKKFISSGILTEELVQQ
ncbi:hypothetical protein GQ457_02G024970 [Hibiscus cannabinus]